MNRRKSGFRIALLASTALTAFALMSGASPNTAFAACPSPNPVYDNVVSTPPTVLGATGAPGQTQIRIIGSGGTVNITDSYQSNTDCTIVLDTSADNKIINFTGANTINSDSGGDATIVIQDGATGNVLNFTSTILTGDSGTVLQDGNGSNTVNLTGVDVTGDILMGGGNDTVSISNSLGFIFAGGSTIDGGGGNDTLILTGTGSGVVNTSTFLTGFEDLVKNGSGSWELQNGTYDYNTLTVNAGTLTVASDATLNLNANTNNVNGGVFVVAGLVNEAGDTTVSGGGTIDVNGGTYNAGDAVGTDTTTINNGTIWVRNGGTYVAGNGPEDTTTLTNANSLLQVDVGTYTANGSVSVLAGLLDVNTGGTFNANDTTTVSGGTLAVQGGAYNAALATVVQGTGVLRVDSGTYTANGTTTVQGGGILRIFGGTYQANSSVSVFGGTLRVDASGIFNAATTTTVSGGALRVDGGTYTATGTTLVNGTGILQVNSGMYVANGATNVNAGNLVVNGGTYDANALTTVQTAGTLTVQGGTYDGVATTINGGGVIRVLSGTYNANGATAVNGGILFVNGTGDYNALSTLTINGGGLVRLDGGTIDTTSTTTINNGLLFVNGGTYTATGTTVVNGGSATLQVDSGTYQANNTVTVNAGLLDVNGGIFNAAHANALIVNGGTAAVQGGTFNATGTTTVQGTGVLRVDSGTYNANNTTNILGNGILLVNGGTYNANAVTLMSGNSQLRVFGLGEYDATGQNINVNATGTVLGTGTIRGTLNNNAGIVTPGPLPGLGAVGTLNLTGTYNQATGGNFQADLQPGGPADLLAVTGNAALLGNVQLNTLASNFAALEQYRIISTQNPIPTIFETATLTGAGLGSNFAWVGRVNDAGVFDLNNPATGNNVDVIFALTPASLPGLTPNQQSVANYLSSYAVAGGVFIEDPTIYLITQIVAGGPNALDQIGGEVYDSFTTFAFDTARQYGRLVDDRVRTLRCAARSGSVSALCATETPTLLADTGPDSIATPGIDSPRGFSPNTHPYGWSVWVSGLGSYLSKDRTTNNLGYNGFTTGGVMGVDLAITKRWLVGIMVGGSKSNINFSGVGGDGDLSNVGIGVYTAWYGSKWFADASFTYSKNWIEADRTLQFGTVDTTAKGKTEGDQFAAHATLGYGFALGRTALELSGGVDWVHLRQYGFTETGAGLLNLSVNSRTDDSLRLRIGVRAAHPFVIRQGLMMVPSLKVGYARELMDNTRPITSSFGGIPGSFTVNGDDGSRNILTFGAGVKAEWSQGITLSVNYDGEWAGDRQIHGVTGRIQFRW